jgi:hypothetical protein
VKSRPLLAVAAAVSGVAAAGCGGSSHTAQSPAATRSALTATTGSSGTFAALTESASPPAGWHQARTPAGAALDYPPAWHAVRGDRGTLSAALQDASGRFLGYLNLTPRQGAERESNWTVFRAAHNRAEGDRQVRVLASVRGLRFRGGRGACVQDSYTTSVGTRYIELACLIEGGRSAVVVGAAPPQQWHAQAPVISRAISTAVL